MARPELPAVGAPYCNDCGTGRQSLSAGEVEPHGDWNRTFRAECENCGNIGVAHIGEQDGPFDPIPTEAEGDLEFSGVE